MFRSARILLPLTAALALLPASGASAATATFTGVFEAERTVEWDRPRIVTTTDCNGEHYNQSKGGETASMTSKPFKVTVETFNGQARFSFGPKKRGVSGGTSITANGPYKRWHERKAGFTGGWCGGARLFENGENDCGGQIPTYKVSFYGNAGRMTWTESYVEEMRNEKLGFYTCTLQVPEGMRNSSFPQLEGEYKQADLFNRRKPTVTIKASKSYGPTIIPVTSSVKQTSKGTFRWKLVLKRTRG